MVSSKSCFQMSVLCFSICMSKPLLRFGSVVYLWFCQMLFLCVIKSLMFCGRTVGVYVCCAVFLWKWGVVSKYGVGMMRAL